MSKEEFVVEFNDNELGECRTYPQNIMGYKQAVKDLKVYKAKQTKKITDLEANLAESEKLTERLQQIVDKLRDKEFAGKTLVEAVNAVYEPLYKNKYDEAEELKQQLAEKERELQDLRFEKRNIFPLVDCLEEKVNREKIAFAVNKLKCVKRYLDMKKRFSFYMYSPEEKEFYILDWDLVSEVIDNYIKQIEDGE